ncbi:hypothetical protein LK09_04815 [Microbacterium mangrovi]|uniref:SnoaL-like domain-containing protein n=1 Tax=Microbacterium mangrovi TaxID=1348253 RepID=A0A0B2A9E5_9MICO|nr:nuclear transport factor 2 family protein [Microbacterium mangrovi]KHK98343.1 hypothetical protein LK09_04815 [Microbacterium mangrovi]
MESDPETTAAVRALIERTYSAMSTPGSDVAALFAAADMAVAGSGQGELMYGPEQVGAVAESIASAALAWNVEDVKVWHRGDVAWAQILGHVVVRVDGESQHVPYWTTGVFGRTEDGWEWLYWGGSEPQENPRV